MADERDMMGQPRRGWWGAGGDYMDQQGCLGCGPGWWIIAGVIVFIIWIWGWGWPGFAGWGGWGWRHPHQAGTTTTTGAPFQPQEGFQQGQAMCPCPPPGETAPQRGEEAQERDDGARQQGQEQQGDTTTNEAPRKRGGQGASGGDQR